MRRRRRRREGGVVARQFVRGFFTANNDEMEEAKKEGRVRDSCHNALEKEDADHQYRGTRLHLEGTLKHFIFDNSGNRSIHNLLTLITLDFLADLSIMSSLLMFSPVIKVFCCTTRRIRTDARVAYQLMSASD